MVPPVSSRSTASGPAEPSADLAGDAGVVRDALEHLAAAYRNGREPSLVDLDATIEALRKLHDRVLDTLRRADSVQIDDVMAARIALSQARVVVSELVHLLQSERTGVERPAP